MPIKRTISYVCDCCGREIDYHREKYQELIVRSHNCANLVRDDWEDVYIYCERCFSYMLTAIHSIPQIMEVAKARGGEHDATY